MIQSEGFFDNLARTGAEADARKYAHGGCGANLL